METCSVPECPNDAPYDMAINGYERPICEDHVEKLLTAILNEPEKVLSVTIEGEDADGNPFTVHHDREPVAPQCDPMGG